MSRRTERHQSLIPRTRPISSSSHGASSSIQQSYKYQRARTDQQKVHYGYGWVYASIGPGGLRAFEGFDVAVKDTALVHMGNVAGMNAARRDVAEGKRKVPENESAHDRPQNKVKPLAARKRGVDKVRGTIVAVPDKPAESIKV